jgi:O-antigen ligase
MANRLLIIYERGDLGGRDVIWQELYPLIGGNPVLGVGETGYAYFAQTTFGRYTSPHNVILEVLCFTGIIGLIIYSLFLFRVFNKGYQHYKTEGLLLPLLLISPVIGMLITGHIIGVKIGWIIFSYIVGSSVFKQKSETIGSIIPLNTYENPSHHR